MRGTVILGCALFALPAVGQDTGLSFLQIGVNAVGGALGDAQVAQVRTAFATYWNPAGLVSEHSSVAGSHRVWVGGVRAYDVAAQLPAGRNSAWGLALTASETDDLEARIQPGEADGYFGAQFISTGISYARVIYGLRAGITGKYLLERIFDTSASGYAFDFGLQADALDGQLHLGAALRNFGRMGKLETERTPLPRLVQGGFAFSPLQIITALEGTRLLDLMLSLGLSHLPDNNLTRFHLGCTVTIMELVDLRGGYISRDELRTYTFGIGFFFDNIDADYAYIPFEDGFDGPGHILSLIYSW